MAINGQKIADALGSLLPVDGSSTDRTRVEEEFLVESKEALISIPAAGGDVDLGVFRPRTTVLVTEVKVEPNASVASNATSYWTFQLVYDDDAGGSDTAITGTWSGSLTALTAQSAVSLSMSTTGGVSVPANKRVSMKITGVDTVVANSFGVNVVFKKPQG